MRTILRWYSENPREYPWRKSPTPYRTWLSEIILQQTRIAQGMPYYERFLAEFPCVEDLAKASEKRVLKLWEGLGYYSRARNLHATAKYISFEKFGVYPDTFLELKKLKGVGPYTAAAIASICFNERVPAMDGNAYRVYARYLGYSKSIDLPKSKKELFDEALRLMATSNPGDYNQAIMDLGAHVCTPKAPSCESCPLQSNCRAFKDKTVQFLPIRSKKTKVKEQHIFFAVYSNGETWAMQEKHDLGFWKGLSVFPILSSEVGVKSSFKTKAKKITSVTHLLSHRKLHLHYLVYETPPSSGDIWLWTKKELQEKAVPKPIAAFLNDFLLNLG